MSIIRNVNEKDKKMAFILTHHLFSFGGYFYYYLDVMYYNTSLELFFFFIFVNYQLHAK